MPVYEFQCLDCENKFECFFHAAGMVKGARCSKCSSKNVKKLFSRFGFKSGGNDRSGGKTGCATCSSSNCSTCR